MPRSGRRLNAPVPRTGKRKRRKYKNARTGSVLSKALPHRYPDEQEKSSWFRRLIRRKEERNWRGEWL